MLSKISLMAARKNPFWECTQSRQKKANAECISLELRARQPENDPSWLGVFCCANHETRNATRSCCTANIHSLALRWGAAPRAGKKMELGRNTGKFAQPVIFPANSGKLCRFKWRSFFSTLNHLPCRFKNQRRLKRQHAEQCCWDAPWSRFPLFSWNSPPQNVSTIVPIFQTISYVFFFFSRLRNAFVFFWIRGMFFIFSLFCR